MISLILTFACLVLLGSPSRRAKMKNACNKGLLIPWLWEALNEQLYEGLKWSDKQRNIFYITWTHKSAEQWSNEVLEPFKAWAAHKGKLEGKNEKQLKATFRCALNSKKDELREVGRNRSQRFWQFIDPNNSDGGKSANKKRRKSSHKLVDIKPVRESNDSLSNSFMDCSASASSTSHDDLLKSSEEKVSKKKKYKINRKLADIERSASPFDAGNTYESYLSPAVSNDATEISRTEKLPPFQSFCSFQPLTPEYQDNETFFSTPEHSTEYNNLPPDTNRLTPPADLPLQNHQTASSYDSFNQQFSTDVYNPNCWSIPAVQQDFNPLNQFFEDFGKSPNQDLNSKMDFLEMDQFVPVMNMSDNTLFRNGPFNYSNKITYEGNQCEQVKFDDDYLFHSNFNTEDCEKVLEELNNIPS